MRQALQIPETDRPTTFCRKGTQCDLHCVERLLCGEFPAGSVLRSSCSSIKTSPGTGVTHETDVTAAFQGPAGIERIHEFGVDYPYKPTAHSTRAARAERRETIKRSEACLLQHIFGTDHALEAPGDSLFNVPLQTPRTGEKSTLQLRRFNRAVCMRGLRSCVSRWPQGIPAKASPGFDRLASDRRCSGPARRLCPAGHSNTSHGVPDHPHHSALPVRHGGPPALGSVT
jgi:hypothetical protein